MRDLLSWNVSLCRIAGIQVRLHAFFLFFAVLAISAGSDIPGRCALALSAIFLFSVAWHEYAHCFAAIQTGGVVEHVLLWPLGGLLPIDQGAGDPRREWPTAVAGISANLLVCAVSAPILMVSDSWEYLHLNPLSLPERLDEVTWQSVLGGLFWVNWTLGLVNLLPGYPLDGARFLRLALWRRIGHRSAVLHVARIGKLIALLLFGTGLLMQPEYPGAFVMMSLLAIVMFFGSRQEIDRLQDSEGGDESLGYDFSHGYASLENAASIQSSPKPTFLRRWLGRRREDRQRRQRELDEIEDRRVDDVLSRLHAYGPSQLTDADRALLERVSLRYRNRLRS